MKTIKSKLMLVYSALVIMIIIVGAISVANINSLGRSIDGLITENYKSINAANNMNNAIDEQDKAALKYLIGDKQEAAVLFNENNAVFNKWFYCERYNITEKGEENIVEDINSSYVDFTKMFSELQQKNSSEAKNFYESSVHSQISKIKTDLNKLSTLNEEAMFRKRGSTSKSAEYSTDSVFVIFVSAAIFGLFLAVIMTNKYLNPIHALIATVKSLREGNLDKQAPVINDDEVGVLAREFNNMTRRLYDFETSTKGTLLAEKNRSNTVMKSISDPLIVLDSSFKIKFINNAFEDFFEMEEEDVINTHFLQVVKRVDVYDYVFKILREDLEEDGEIIEISKGKRNYFFNITVRVIKDKDQSIDGAIVFFKDVSELKHLEMIKTDFIGTVSHELKTPLTSLMMGVGLLNDKKLGALNEKQHRILETLKEDVEKLNGLVMNLLKISKLETDKAAFDMEVCNILEIIYKSISKFKKLIEGKKISIYYEIEDKLPDIVGDSEKISWVLNNIISNAIRYTEKGAITVGAYKDDDNVFIYVKDTGRGIPKEFIEKIFEKFVRVEGFEVMPESTGLGLAIAKDIVKAHGGDIWCESELDNGSKFIFSLPIRDTEDIV
ncbi:ATP-binding protein [Clostridium sp. C8-1-8]|uniref:ATP-binding protein n=1 Tax=Clostridium sp. C8-1-8 TaxID=2698831 RepID=UPI00137062E5|nr:ATP-binding protein [Clostridium sp. C8-1-8]